MIKSKSYYFNPLPCTVTIHVGSSVKELGDKLKVSLRDASEAFCVNNGGHTDICILPNSPVDHIVHETAHATFFILAYPGMENYPTTGTHEMFCYYQQYLFNEVVKFQKKVKPLFRRKRGN